MVNLTSQQLQELGKCYGASFTGGETEARDGVVVCLRSYTARAGKVNSHEVMLTVPVLSGTAWIPPATVGSRSDLGGAVLVGRSSFQGKMRPGCADA